MSNKAKAPWVVLAPPNGAAWCQRCNAKLEMQMPCDMEVFSAAYGAFLKVHTKCKEQKVGAE